MKKVYLKKSGKGRLMTLSILAAGLSAMAQPSITFTHTGAMQTFTVPNCVASVTILARGAQGANAGLTGANGASARAIMTVTAGQVLNVFVGGQGTGTMGGFNGGGNGGVSAQSNGGGGGGASDVRVGGISLADRVIVAAGGGGSGGNTTYNPTPGAGGGGNAFTSAIGFGGVGANGCALGSNGGESGGTGPSYGSGGGGGGYLSGGGGGGQPAAATGGWGCNGTLGNGGAGGGTSFICGGATGGQNGGGGGGGGYYGGGGGMTGTGGCNGGGGGGSSWVSNALTAASFTAANVTGHGQITIFYDIGVPTLTISGNNNVCTGSSTTLTATGSAANYTWSNGSQGSSIVITPTANTTYSVASQGTAACPAYGLYTVSLVQLPVVTATASPNYIICPGVPVTLSGGGADQYTWTGGISNATPFNASVTTAFTVTGTNTLTGCSNTAVVNVPVYVANVSVSSPTSICAGGSANLSASGAISYTWSTGSQFPQISVNPNTTTVYTVNATTSDFCIASNTTTVTVNPSPTIQASSAKAEICRGESVQLTANGASTYSWNTGGTGSSITVSPNSNTTYTVTGLNSGGCASSSTVSVKVNLCIGIGEISAMDYSGVTVYPNPSAGTFALTSKTALSLKLTNQLGQTLQTIQLDESNNFSASIEGLSQGMYFLSTLKDGKLVNVKLMVKD